MVPGKDVSDASANWERIQDYLRDEFGDAVFKSWLRPLTLGQAKGGEIVLFVPTRFMRDWVDRHYMDRIRKHWSEEDPAVRSVRIRVHRGKSPPSAVT